MTYPIAAKTGAAGEGNIADIRRKAGGNTFIDDQRAVLEV